MDEKKLAVILQTTLEKNGIKKELAEIQKIVNRDMITIVPKLETASLMNDLKSISNEITQTLNSALGKELTLDAGDVFKALNQELKQISTTTAQISTDIKSATEQLTKSLSSSKFTDSVSNIANLSTILNNIQYSKIFEVFKVNPD